MNRTRMPDTTLIALATLAGVAVAVGAYASLATISTPSHLGKRMDALEAEIESTQTAFSRPRDPSHYLPDPICRVGPSSAGEQVRAELTAAARQSGLAVPAITLASSRDDLSSEVFPVMFTLDVTDRYDLVLSFLNRLAQSEPEVFADSVDLTSKTSAVSLKLTGRVECQSSS